MRIDWVPASAASLVAGSTLLALGSMLMSSGDSAADSLHLVEQDDGRWLAVSALFFLAAAALVLGLPALLTLVQTRGSTLGLLGSGVFLIGCLGTAGYAMLLAFFRALALSDAVRADALDDVVRDPGLNGYLFLWVGAFYLGELLLALALLRAGTTPRWVPWLIIAHVALLPVGTVIPALAGSWTVVLLTFGLVGVAVAANARSSPSRS